MTTIEIKEQARPVTSLMKFLNKVYEAVGEYQGEGEIPKFLYFQDKFMKDLFHFYPERVCVNCAPLNFETEMFLLTFSCEDSNGRSQVIAFAVLLVEEKKSLLSIFNTFRRHNPKWRRIRILILDPLLGAREAIKESFPGPELITSFYHARKVFVNYISNLPGPKTVHQEHMVEATELLKNMFICNESDFRILCQISQTLPFPISSYFQELISKEKDWRIPLDYDHENLFEHLDFYLKDLNDNIQSIASRQKSYIEFIKELYLMFMLKRKEKPDIFLHPISFLYSRYSSEYKISETLTPYAAKFVIEQYDLSSDLITQVDNNEIVTFTCSGTLVTSSDTSCSCCFFLLTLLPCRHIFAVRRIKCLFDFDESMIDHTWKLDNYKQNLKLLQEHFARGTDNRIPQDKDSRISLASHLLEITVSKLIETPENVYKSRIEVLKKLKQAWEKGEEVNLRFIGIEKSLNDKESVEPFKPNFSVAIKPDSEVENSKNSNLSYNKKEFFDNLSCSLGETVFKDNQISCQDINSINKVDELISEKISLLECQTFEIHNSNKTNMSLVRNSSPSSNITSNPSYSNEDEINDANENPVKSQIGNSYEMKQSTKHQLQNFRTNLLDGEHINLAYILCVICVTKESCVNWLRSHGFIPSSMKCVCKGEMMSKNLLRLNDGVAWSCLKHGERKCIGKRFSVRAGTWFEESNLTLEQLLIFTYMWLNKYGKAQIVTEAAISSAKYVKWDKFHRRVCAASLNDDNVNDQATSVKSASEYKDSLDKWLQKHSGKDTFLEFLKDAAVFYEKMKNSNITFI